MRYESCNRKELQHLYRYEFVLNTHTCLGGRRMCKIFSPTKVTTDNQVNKKNALKELMGELWTQTFKRIKLQRNKPFLAFTVLHIQRGKIKPQDSY
jgi:hypothetical protein